MSSGIDRNWIELRNPALLAEVMPHYAGGDNGGLVSTATQASLLQLAPRLNHL